MRRFPLTMLTALLLVFAACSDEPAAPESTSSPDGRLASVSGGAEGDVDLKDRHIVVFRESVANTDAMIDELTRGNGAVVHYRYRHAIKGFCATIPPMALEGLRRNPNVDFIEADGPMSIFTTQSLPTSGQLWGLDRIDQRNLPYSYSYTYNEDGTGVTAYILDTGIRYDHQQFGNPSRASFGFDAFGGNGADANGHGTHVSGTVGGVTTGVAKNVALVSVRVLNAQGSGTTSGVIAGIDWVRNNYSAPAVANMSLGGGASSALDLAVANAVAAGVTFVVSAGNSSAPACNYSPAREPSAITVGSTTSSDARSSFSNYGSCVDIFAPGSSIYSAWYTSTTAYNTISGTSMASPHVAGAAALYLDANSGATPAQVASALASNATTGVVGNAGTGSPNLLLFTIAGTPPPPPPPPPPLVYVHVGAASTSTTSVRNTWRASMSVTVHDDSHVPVSGATVTVAWSGGASGSASAVTNGSGVAVVNTPNLNKKVSSISMNVSGITGTNMSYASGSNHATLPVTVNKP